MSENLPWRDAIIEVMKGQKEPMSPSDIADAVRERNLRTDFGATPDATVGANIYSSLKTEGVASPFVRAGKALFLLRTSDAPPFSATEQKVLENEASTATAEAAGVVNAFGMFWERSRINWASSHPKILGQQANGTVPVDFCEQNGVYLLYDTQGVVYVGRAVDQGLGKRLWQHTTDRLNGRWNRFSWFGVYPVEESGKLRVDTDFSKVGIDTVIITMEAVLIEGLEPRQNKKGGDKFRAIEYLQVEDPKLQAQRHLSILSELSAKLRET